MQATQTSGVTAPSVSPDEIARFDALADQWWDPRGPLGPLHQMNPARIGWIEERIRTRFPAGGVRLLDVGCGGGLAAEALARNGHDVLGIDVAPAPLKAARAHAAAAGEGLRLAYRDTTAEALCAEGARFDVVTALELMEHVADPASFLRTLAGLVVPGGLVFLSTVNRTRRSWLFAIVGAEYVMRMLPVGTHDWHRFVTPAELGTLLRRAGLRLADLAGLLPDLRHGGWRAGRDTAVNYIAMAQR
jgi:2-polyprenyl-6-hydroxyphenyl methylase/3-demethylubiquinone-9 3-methyltransferase